jgi:putative membrane protein
MQPTAKWITDKTAITLTTIITVVVFTTVTVLGSKIIPAPAIPEIVKSFPKFSAIINALTSIVLILSFVSIKNKKIELHRKFNYTAMILSGIFLVLYIATHFFFPDMRFGDTNHDFVVDDAEKAAAGSARIIYLFILISHIMLAAIVLPMVLLSFHYGKTNNVVKHRKLTRYSFPIWLYVTVTGVIVYLLISPYYYFPN